MTLHESKFVPMRWRRTVQTEWQRMVLSETRGLWLSSIVRGGIGLHRRLSARRHEKPDIVTGYFPSKPSVSRTRRPPPGMVPRDGTDSQPEALKLLVVVSNSWRRNVPPFSRRST